MHVPALFWPVSNVAQHSLRPKHTLREGVMFENTIGDKVIDVIGRACAWDITVTS